MTTTPQFRVIFGADGGATLTMNEKCLRLVLAQLRLAPPGEKPRALVVREALIAKLDRSDGPPADPDLDPCA